ncbi:putative ribonuclease p complex subunit protein [Botrytis fragariae]|uniref:Putative ribonuclease p complex subunit protein n=1 Tax=Botrytis fragariae TaxID=1964551 RepID=A0A8H6AQZ9_9HELO|nr:putative ribonuclease p complex subunit protein [Botrytis fragariae]KAF5871775.1 putative ribonuclease p complex subunit protein [Botrytis fragariae]
MNRPTEHQLRPFGRESRFESLYDEYRRATNPYFVYDSEPFRRAARERYRPEFRLSRSFDRTTKNGGRILSPESTESMFDSSSDYEDARYKDTLPFGKAMKKLRTVIKDAGVIYSGVLKEYDSDVQSVKTYTPERILRQLWTLKLDSVSKIAEPTEDLNQHARYGNPDQDTNIKKVDDSEDTLYEQLNHQIAQVMEALKQARVSTVEEKSSATVFKASERLKEKIDTTGRQILELFQRARDGSQDCEALLDELNGLYTLLEGNKKLYANEKEGENIESSVSS